MSDDTKKGGKPTLSLRRTTSEIGRVRQNVARGRSKTVVVETKRKRVIAKPGAGPAAPAEPTQPKAPKPEAAAEEIREHGTEVFTQAADVRDYEALLQLQGEYEIVEMEVEPDDWWANKTLAELRATFDVMKQAWEERKAALEKEQEAIVKHARELKAKRETVVATLPPEDVARYETMRKKLGGVAIAKMEGRSCGGCGASLPTSVVQKVHAGQVVKCPICGRLLYD
jgi:translation initiation factor IF-2